ncbi:hypothetical protein AB0B31_11080 [Catellatospora citrea]|uniref:hypothetical protein n=1 Tax=Catellatospora citrea TaxID=53366 RepID=UPI0033ECE8FD
MNLTSMAGGVSLSATHAHPGGVHTLLLCLPGRPDHGPDLMAFAQLRLEHIGVDASASELLCPRHLMAAPAPGSAPAPVCAADAGLLALHDTGRHHLEAALDIYEQWRRVVADTGHAKTLARVPLLRIGDPATDRPAWRQIIDQPRLRAMTAADPQLLLPEHAEGLGLGLHALQSGQQRYTAYAIATAMFGHALLPVTGPLMRSGPGLPHADHLAARMRYADAAADYLAGLHDATVLTLHFTLPS